MTHSQAVKMFFSQVRRTHLIHFPIKKTPNAETTKVIKEAKKGENLVVLKDVNDLFDKLGI